MSYITAPFDFDAIQHAAKTDPRGFMAECDHALNGRILRAAAAVAAGAKERPVVLLSGPSGSGKTTTAGKLAQELEWQGIQAHVISMDDYFRTVDKETHPKDKDGNIDYESPLCMDIPLLVEHFSELSKGFEVMIPRYDFKSQRRADGAGRPLRLGNDEIAIFEGIHALNPLLLGENKRSHQKETRIYVSARANIRKEKRIIFKGTWMRLIRRLIRDDNFRGMSAQGTMRLWANVRRGEKKYISPYKERADIIIDTALGYELSALKRNALKLFEVIPGDIERAEELHKVALELGEFYSIHADWVSKRSLIREFIGNGVL
ncbi:MAG: nucleoside kinase [Oscillospiraceae bacterium]|nr:nucleoside kinase [Oscillospiraceae bacterium]